MKSYMGRSVAKKVENIQFRLPFPGEVARNSEQEN